MRKVVTIGDLGEVITGKTPPKSNKNFYGDYAVFIKPTDISEDHKYTYETEEMYSQLAAEQYKSSLVPKGAICVPCIGTIGTKMTMTHCACYTNQSINSIVCNDNYDNEYVYYLIKNFLPGLKAYNLGTASGREYVSKSNFELIEIEVEQDKETQHRIATILSRYDSLIENYQKQIKLLEEAAQRLYKEWFIDLHFPGHENTNIIDGVPEGWEKKKLIDLVNVQYGYAFDGHLFNSKGEGTPIVRIRNIPDGYTNDYTTEEANESYIVNDGDLLIGMDGIFHINTWCGGKAYLVQRACSFRPKDVSMKGFILQAIFEPIKFFENTVVGATVAHLGKKHIDSIELLVSNNDKMYKPFEKMFNERQTLKSQLRLLTEARDRLLPKLMNCEINV